MSKVFYTLEINNKSRRFIDYANTKDYYVHDYLPYDSIDGTNYLRLRNTVGLTLIEGLNQWIPFGASAYITYEHRQFTLPDSTGGTGRDHTHIYKESDIILGGKLHRTTGETFHFNTTAETVLAGTQFGDFRINGNAHLNLHLGHTPLRLSIEGYIKNKRPSFYYNHYHSQHSWWDNRLNKEFRTRLGGSINIDHWHTKLYAGIENIKNYTYLAGTPYTPPTSIGSHIPVSLNDITTCQYEKNRHKNQQLYISYTAASKQILVKTKDPLFSQGAFLGEG